MEEPVDLGVVLVVDSVEEAELVEVVVDSVEVELMVVGMEVDLVEGELLGEDQELEVDLEVVVLVLEVDLVGEDQELEVDLEGVVLVLEVDLVEVGLVLEVDLVGEDQELEVDLEGVVLVLEVDLVEVGLVLEVDLVEVGLVMLEVEQTQVVDSVEELVEDSEEQAVDSVEQVEPLTIRLGGAPRTPVAPLPPLGLTVSRTLWVSKVGVGLFLLVLEGAFLDLRALFVRIPTLNTYIASSY